MDNYDFLCSRAKTDNEIFALGVARTHFPKNTIKDIEPIARTFSDVENEIMLPNVIFVGDVSLHISSQDETNLFFNFLQNDGIFTFSRVTPAGGMFYESSVFPISCLGSYVTAGGNNSAFFGLTFNGFALYTEPTSYKITP